MRPWWSSRGGGGIPVVRAAGGHTLQGVDAVIDKDLTSTLLAQELGANRLAIATDVDAAYLDWGTPSQRAQGKVSPHELLGHSFPAGSMGSKVQAATGFVLKAGKKALIGSLARIEEMLAGRAATEVGPQCGTAT